MDEYYLTGETTFVADFISDKNIKQAQDLFFLKYEDWIPVTSEVYWVESQVFPENVTSNRVQSK